MEKKVLNDSFFNFFNPPAIQDEEELDSDTEALLDSDFQIGSTFKVYKLYSCAKLDLRKNY